MRSQRQALQKYETLILSFYDLGQSKVRGDYAAVAKESTKDSSEGNESIEKCKLKDLIIY